MLLASRPRMDPEVNRQFAVPPGPKGTVMLNPNDSYSMAQLLQLLENQLSKHTDESRYASSTLKKLEERGRTDTEWLGTTSTMA